MQKEVKSFCSARAWEVIQQLCYPRRTASEAEREAANFIAEKFTRFEMIVERKRFPVQYLYENWRSAALLLIATVSMLNAADLAIEAPLLSGSLAAMSFLAVHLPWLSLSTSQRKPGKPQGHSENLIARPQHTPLQPTSRVVFMAHYDTKSQLLPSGVRVFLVTFALANSLLFGLGCLAQIIGVPVWQAVSAWWLSIPFAVAASVLACNFSGNRSPGALDNGSGVGVLLELARTWRPAEGLKLDVLFVATGAEETGLEGAHVFLQENRHLWHEIPTLLINLESVGAGRFVYLMGEERAQQLAHRTADELGIPHAPFKVVGAGMDHQPFAAQGLPSVSLLGDVVRYSMVMHTPRDGMRNIQHEALERAGLLAIALAQRWAHLHSASSETLFVS